MAGDKPSASGASARHFALHGAAIEAKRPAGGLYLVATPIGNLGDITLRALEVLAGADVIACEDTRVTRRLTERYGIATPLTPYHEHNAAEARPQLLKRLAEGQAVALVSDAGTPLDLRSRLQAGAGGLRSGTHGHRAARRVGGAGGAVGRRPADRPLLLRRLPAAEAGGAAEAHRRARRHSGNPGAVRERAAAGRDARRSGRRAGRARRGDLPRADQAARGGQARRSRAVGADLRRGRRNARRDRHRGGAAGRRSGASRRCRRHAAAARSPASRSRTRSARSRSPPGVRAARSIGARSNSPRTAAMARDDRRPPKSGAARQAAAAAGARR